MAQPEDLAQKTSQETLILAFLCELQKLYPAFIFKAGSRFRFHPPKTIYYEMINNHELTSNFTCQKTISAKSISAPHHATSVKNTSAPQNSNILFQSFALQLLHELGHAVSKHYNYHLSIERLKLETEAWQIAKKIFELHPEWRINYRLTFDQDFVELHLDTYRHWLHQKATCPKCGLTMFQNSNQTWLCPHCDLF